MDLDGLRSEQAMLSKRVSLRDGFGDIRRVAGFDLAFSGRGIFCAGVVLDYEDMGLIEVKTAGMKETFPYIPTFLSYRESPAVLKTYMRLEKKPDIIFLNGHGVCHPRGLGLASHVGICLNKPSIGVASARLCGDFREPAPLRQERITFCGRQVGWVFRYGRFQKIFISPGHMVSMESSINITLECLKGQKLPEPLRLAHLYANRERMKHGKHKNG
jgi:deoxyribonuclease V